MTNEELIRQELSRRLASNQARQGQVDSRLNQFDAVNSLPDQAQASMRPTASLVDTWTGSNLASTVKEQPDPRELVKSKLYARMQQPRENTDSLLGMLASRDLARDKMEKGKGPKELSQSTIMKLNEGNSIPSMLSNVNQIIDQNQDAFGPVVGRARSYNAYDTKARGIDAEIRAKSQAFGRFMEGGVLRKEDEEKYRKMFPNLADTPDVAKKKLQVVSDLLEDKQKSNIAAFQNQGYDTRGLELPDSKQPSAMTSGAQKSISDLSDEELMLIANGG